MHGFSRRSAPIDDTVLAVRPLEGETPHGNLPRSAHDFPAYNCCGVKGGGHENNLHRRTLK